MEIQPGMTGTAETVVTDALTAVAAGSGTLPVFATPHLAALMERAAWMLVQPYLDEGKTTVGTRLELAHTAATPLGMRVRATAEVTAVSGRTVTFRVTAFDEAGEIGAGTHERVIVTADSFLSRAQLKRNP